MKARGILRGGSSIGAAAVAAVALALPAAAAADWHAAGNPVTQSSAAFHGFDLKRIGGIPYVAWSESNGHNYVIQVARLEPGGGKWLRVGPGPLNHDLGNDAETPSLAAGPGGVPWVTWAESNRRPPGAQIHAAHLSGDGKKWVEPDGRDWAINYLPPNAKPNPPDTYQFFAAMPRLTFFGGTPYITYLQDNGVEYEVDVVRLAGRGNAWERVSHGTTRDQNLPRTPRAMVFDGALYAAVTEGFDGVTVDRRGGDRRWRSVGPYGLVTGPVQGRQQGVLLDLAGFLGEPYVLWHGVRSPGSVVVSRFTGGAWQPAGGGSLGAGEDRQGGSLRVIGGRLYASWVDAGMGALHVSRLSEDGKSWIETPGPINHDTVAPVPSGDNQANQGPLTGIDGTPYVAWAETDASGLTSLRVASLDGAPAAIGPDDGDGSDLSATPPAGDDQSADGDGSHPLTPARGPCGLILRGTARPDALRGTVGRDSIQGLAGNDKLQGLAGNDCLSGGAGNDLLDGGSGADVIHGGPANDVLRGGAQEDRLYGGRGSDHLYGGGDDDLLVGGPGRDVLVGGAGWDTFRAGPGNDVIYAADGRAESVDCGSGFDTVYADRHDRLHGCERVKIVR